MPQRLQPEQQARERIDKMLEAAGWVVQDVDEPDHSALCVLAEEIDDDLRSALAQIEDVLGDLQARAQHLGID